MLNDFEYSDVQEAMENDGLFEGGYDWEDDEGSYESMDILESLENEDEEDMFLGGLVSGISKVASGPLGGMVGGVLKNLATQAAGSAGRAIAGQRGGRIAHSIARRCLREADFEGDFESMEDFDYELASVGGDMSVLGEMAHLANMATRAQSPQQADQFIGAIASLASNLLPQLMQEGESDFEEEGDEFFPALLPLAAQVLPAAMPLISKGIGAIGKFLSRKARMREAAAVLPPISAKAVTSLVKQAQAGKKITKDRVAATVANAAAKTLATKPAVAKAVRANKKLVKQIQATREDEGEWSGYLSYGGPSQNMGSYGRSASQGYGRRRRIIRPRYCVY